LRAALFFLATLVLRHWIAETGAFRVFQPANN
jgi:hypothetical protein